MADNNTEYSSRVQGTRDSEGTVLTIRDVQLSDEREFFCQVNGMEYGVTERKTSLRVFGKKAPAKENFSDCLKRKS